MRKVLSLLVIVALLFGLMLISGCQNFDWQSAAKTIAIEWVKDKVIVALDKFKTVEPEAKVLATDWILGQVDKAAGQSKILKKGLSYIDIKPLVSDAWDYLILKAYEVARKNGMDTDADTTDQLSWYVSGADFPDLTSIMMKRIE
jgi:hypothetical protein